MIGMDCINQQTVSDRDCLHCIWHTDGRCASWDCEYISRAEALEALEKVKAMESAQPEKLTDKEQRIFLSAMGREEKVCEEVDRNYVREPYEDSLMYVCKEIKRKVKGALWT